MSADALFNLLKELKKDIKCEAFPSISLLFHNEFNKFDNTGAQLSYDTKFTLKSCFMVKNSRLCHLCVCCMLYGRHYIEDLT